MTNRESYDVPTFVVHEHSPVPIFGEGVDIEELVPIGYACSQCGKELVSLVPRKNSQYATPLSARQAA